MTTRAKQNPNQRADESRDARFKSEMWADGFWLVGLEVGVTVVIVALLYGAVCNSDWYNILSRIVAVLTSIFTLVLILKYFPRFLLSFSDTSISREYRHSTVVTAFIASNLITIVVIFACLYWLSDYSGAMGITGNCLTKDGSFGQKLADCIYFSVITLTTVGYGDCSPTGVGKIVAGTEALAGYATLGLLVSSISNVFRPNRGDNNH